MGENPFPAGTSAHDAWGRATAKAEIEILEVVTRNATKPDGISWSDHIAVATGEKFDVWAKRDLHVVWNDRSREVYDESIVEQANCWLEELGNHFKARPWPPSSPVTARAILDATRRRLEHRVAAWQLRARRLVAKLKATAAPPLPPPPDPIELKAKRRRIVERFKTAHGLNAHGLARRAGISTTGIRGMVSGDRRRFSPSTEARFLELLGIGKDDWYRT